MRNLMLLPSGLRRVPSNSLGQLLCEDCDGRVLRECRSLASVVQSRLLVPVEAVWVNIDTLTERANSAYFVSISDIRTPYTPRQSLCVNLPVLKVRYSDKWIEFSQVPAGARSRRGERRNPVPACGLGIV